MPCRTHRKSRRSCNLGEPKTPNTSVQWNNLSLLPCASPPQISQLRRNLWRFLVVAVLQFLSATMDSESSLPIGWSSSICRCSSLEILSLVDMINLIYASFYDHKRVRYKAIQRVNNRNVMSEGNYLYWETESERNTDRKWRQRREEKNYSFGLRLNFCLFSSH